MKGLRVGASLIYAATLGLLCSGASAVEAPPGLVSAPGLHPSFHRTVHDYAVRDCSSVLRVEHPAGMRVRIALRPGNWLLQTHRLLRLEPGQDLNFSLRWLGRRGEAHFGRYHIRCLPPSFPRYTYRRLGEPDHDFYMVTPVRPSWEPGWTADPYVIIFNGWGVPVWWYHATDGYPNDAKVLPDGNLSWWSFGSGYVVRDAAGRLIATHKVVGPYTDFHDMQAVPGSDDVYMLTTRRRSGVDVRPYADDASANVIDGIVQQISPDGALQWEWSSAGRIDLAETGRWWTSDARELDYFDLVHLNSVEPSGNSLILSFRMLDAVYSISKRTGKVQWKLGGTHTAESLRVIGDPYGDYPFGGQHDARVQPDGTITVHDNATGLDHPPRVVRYRINRMAGTARLLESHSDPLVENSGCCGGARRDPETGAWTISWGQHPIVTEFNAEWRRTFLIEFLDTGFSYRVVPADEPLLQARELRRGMDAQYRAGS